MPDTRSHRGPHPEDAHLFAPGNWPHLRTAADDLCWLLDRGYAARSAVELVGNRYSLTDRQRLAVARSSCSRDSAANRQRREVPPSAVAGEELWIDGLNVLTGVEVALGGGVVLIGRDGCCRDVAGLHRHYRKVEETGPALRLIGTAIQALGIKRCCWLLDRPVSNTGRLKSLILALSSAQGWDWTAELEYNPDGILSQTEGIVVTSDSAILDRCRKWFNLLRMVISQFPAAQVVDLSIAGPQAGCVPQTLEQE